jgi:hypothetical protein
MRAIGAKATVLAVCVVSFAAWSRPWIEYFREKNGTRSEYDAASIRRTGPQLTVWARTTNPPNSRKKTKEVLQRLAFDCAKELAGVEETWTLSRGGDREPSPYKLPLSTPAPDSSLAVLMTQLCIKKR